MAGFGFRPEADDPPRNGEGGHRRWWRGTGGAALRIKDRKHLACPSTMLRMVPLPQRGGSATSASHPKADVGAQGPGYIGPELSKPDHDPPRERGRDAVHQLQHLHHARSEEHTSELQQLMRIPVAGFCLKKKKQDKKH